MGSPADARGAGEPVMAFKVTDWLPEIIFLLLALVLWLLQGGFD